jgi:hypothetical protein
MSMILTSVARSIVLPATVNRLTLLISSVPGGE